ncbi:glycosyltransferase [Kallotenue papyrolyticum]|uniref:glycosyltransferase n=1 Tax=Kallotenue papyrolyticum TaxID=1325125 RepID=UPI0004926386|nr:glycosyltransferase [Kallotenue papyrolyticum]
MHIVQIYKDYPPVVGGIEQHVRVLAEGLAQRGQQVTVLTTHAGRATREEQRNGVRVLRAGRLAYVASTPLSLQLLRLARSLRADLVHLHMPFPPGDLAALALPGAPALVVTYHSDIVRQRRLGQFYRPLQQLTLRRAHCIIATSAAYVRSSPVLRRYAARTHIVPLSVDVERFAHATGGTALRRRYLERGEGCLVLAVGVLRYYKGLPILIDAMTQLDATLLIVGGGPEEQRLRDLVQALGLARRVHFAGRVSDDELPAYYAAADLFVLPSHLRAEAFGIVQLEAMAAGLPVISTELGTGTSEVNQHGVTGFVVPPGDPLLLARAMRVLLENPDLRRHMGRAAQARARREYTHARMIERVLAVYAQAAQRAHGDVNQREQTR